MSEIRKNDKLGMYLAAAFIFALILSLFVGYRGIVMLERVTEMNVEIAKHSVRAADIADIEMRVNMLENSAQAQPKQ